MCYQMERRIHQVTGTATSSASVSHHFLRCSKSEAALTFTQSLKRSQASASSSLSFWADMIILKTRRVFRCTTGHSALSLSFFTPHALTHVDHRAHTRSDAYVTPYPSARRPPQLPRRQHHLQHEPLASSLYRHSMLGLRRPRHHHRRERHRIRIGGASFAAVTGLGAEQGMARWGSGEMGRWMEFWRPTWFLTRKSA
jgi:hypothetical protein